MKNRIKKLFNKNRNTIIGSIVIFVFAICVILIDNQKTISVSNNTVNLSTKKIEWGIKRSSNHQQPDLGRVNKGLIDKYNGMAMGNVDSKKVYLTFDMGYEAGYTEKILEVLKQNSVKAAFFITAHYVNTQPELVQKMIDEGHIVGNQSPHTLMEL